MCIRDRLLVDAIEQNIDYLELDQANLTLVFNKIDLLESSASLDGLAISATNGSGISELREYIKSLAGYQEENETIFTARRRHITALEEARDAVERGLDQLKIHNAGELLADELLQAQNFLNDITGEFSADDLLGEIFSGFCIGK